MRHKPLFIWVIIALAPIVSSAEETDPKAILEKVTSAYKALDTYSDEGKITSEIDSGQGKMTLETSFSIKLKKPNLYVITWKQANALMPAMSQAGTVWNAGDQPYLYMSITKAYSKMKDDEIALASATGVSGGAAFTIPSLFFSSLKKYEPFARLTSTKLVGTEAVDGEECYLIEGISSISKSEKYWIAKDSSLIKKFSRSFEPPEGGTVFPQATEEQLEQAVKGLGQKVTEERKAAMRKMLKQAQAATSNLKGDSTEVHSKITTSPLEEKDFEFAVPKDAVLKDSLFGGVLDGKVPDFTPPDKASPGKVEAKDK
jgi:hypothetical protein